MARRKRESTAKRVGYVFLSLIFAVIALLLLARLGMSFHPGTGPAAAAVRGSTDLGAQLDNSFSNSKAEALGSIATIKKHYVIPEDALAAPVPDPNGFGTVSIAEADKVMAVIDKARKSGLLDGQEVLFNPNADFYQDSFIGYYYDETILMIIWKEVINGNTCSCCEVKIADGSQIRRKIADDTLGSPVWYYASDLARTVNPVVAMNADFYMFRDFGIVAYQRKLWRMDESTYTGQYKKYNCVETCFVDANGDFHFTHLLEEHSRNEIQDFMASNDILFSLSFGPVLVENGELKSCDWYPAGEIDRGYSRAGIGQKDHLHYFYMSLNHSAYKEARWTVNTFGERMYERGLQQAYCLDGGQTSEIVWRGAPFNYIDFGGEREVSDIMYFATAIPDSGGTP